MLRDFLHCNLVNICTFPHLPSGKSWKGGVNLWMGGVNLWMGGVNLWLGGVNLWEFRRLTHLPSGKSLNKSEIHDESPPKTQDLCFSDEGNLLWASPSRDFLHQKNVNLEFWGVIYPVNKGEMNENQNFGS